MTTQMTHIVPAYRKTPHLASPTSVFLECPTDLPWLRMPEAERWYAICPCAVVGEQLALTTGQGFGYRGGLVIDHALPRSWGGHTAMPSTALAPARQCPPMGAHRWGRFRVGSLGGAVRSYDARVGEAFSIPAVYGLN